MWQSETAEEERPTSDLVALVGLGNPGHQYLRTRHNIGFVVLDEWSQQLDMAFQPTGRTYLAAEGEIGHRGAILIKPMTFMNKSGVAVVEALERYRFTEFIVICDDVNLDFGTLRLRGSGSDGGNNGLASVISEIDSQDFCRLRIGVGRPDDETPLVDYVLDEFNTAEDEQLPSIVDQTIKQLKTYISDGWRMAASRYNGRVTPA